MPPVVSIPLAALFYGIFYGLVGSLFRMPNYVDGVFAGFMLGYVIYDMTHYALHHFSFKGVLREAAPPPYGTPLQDP